LSGFERYSDVFPAGKTANQGRENSKATAFELFLTESCRWSKSQFNPNALALGFY